MKIIKLAKKENFNLDYESFHNKGNPQDLDFFISNFKFGKENVSEDWTVSLFQNHSHRMNGRLIDFRDISFSKDSTNLYVKLGKEEYTIQLGMIDYIVLDLENFNKINIFEKYSGKEYRIEKRGYVNPFKNTKIQY